MLPAAHAAPAPTIEVENIGGGVSARFDFHSPVEVNSFYLTGPHRLVIDVTGAVIEGGPVTKEIGGTHVSSVRYAQNRREPDVVRIVFDLVAEHKLKPEIDTAAGLVVVSESVSKKFPGVSVKKHSDSVEVVLPFAETPVFSREKVEDPPRFVLDFPGYTPEKALEEIEVGSGIVRDVRVSLFSTEPDVTRVVIETSMPAKIETEQSGRKLVAKVFQPSLFGKTVCVDAGHGGHDPGAQVPGTDEKDIVLDVALRLEKLLRAAGAKVVMTRTKDVFIKLEERANIANRAGADVLVSIHANALENHEYKGYVRGIQVYHYKTSNDELAKTLRDSLARSEAIGDWGVYGSEFVVLRHTRMRAALAELGFMTHADDMALMNDDTFRENAARGLFNGLETYFGGRGLELPGIELSREMVAHLPERPFNYVYASTGNVLLSDFPEAGEVAERPALPDIPDFISVVPAYEEGLTHEVGGDSTSASASGVSPVPEKSTSLRTTK